MLVAKQFIHDKLTPLYPKEEIESITRLIFENVLGLSPLQIHLNWQETISSANLAQITEIISRLVQFEPIQYIFGSTEFYGLPFKVTPAVLIPRPETEELVDWIITDYAKLRPIILDIGTGSGCISITLVKNLPESAADAWDVSPEALLVAQENARNNDVTIAFSCIDILGMETYPATKKYDLIVSNPPYVTRSEQPLMHKNVTDFEPHLALFVTDSDPLLFYRTIAEFAFNHLTKGGHLYFEINEQYGTELSTLLVAKGFVNVTLRTDLQQKQRMIRCQKG